MAKDILTLLPVVVDLDGTLIYSDTTWEITLKAIKHNPLNVLKILMLYILKGKVALKAWLAKHYELDTSLLPFNKPLLEKLHEYKRKGHKIILATGSFHSIPEKIVKNLPVFDEVLATHDNTNLVGENKAHTLIERYGDGNFIYFGNSSQDLPVWRHSHTGYIVNGTRSLYKKAAVNNASINLFSLKEPTLASIIKAMRVHQWVKNLLVFVPVLTAHQVLQLNTWVASIIMFFAFSCTASAVYLLNDMLDIETDRAHSRKKYRPFAKGTLAIPTGIIASAILLVIASTLAGQLGVNTLLILGAYFLTTCLYSFKLKYCLVLDIVVLGLLYTQRIIAGSVATHIDTTFWLLALSVFFFLSLAFMKRYSELMHKLQSSPTVTVASYTDKDMPFLSTSGIASGLMAVLILALYIQSPQVLLLYKTPYVLWGVCIIALYWILLFWSKAYRGELGNADPVVYAVSDKASYLCALVIVILALTAVAGL